MAENAALSGTAWIVLGLLAWLRPDGSIGRRTAAGLLLSVTTLLHLSLVSGPILGNLDAPVWTQAHSPTSAPWLLLAISSVAAVIGGLSVSRLRNPGPDPESLPDGPVTGPPRNGRTIWIGRAASPAFAWKTLTAGCIMAGLAVLGTEWMIIPAILTLATLHFWSGLTAIFDGFTLVVRGRIPLLPLRRIDLGQIETAEAIDVDPKEKGWGWRLKRVNRHSVIIRKGEALLVALRGGGEFVVTVDDAAAGAEEIRRALRAQAPRAPHEPGQPHGPRRPYGPHKPFVPSEPGATPSRAYERGKRRPQEPRQPR